MRSRCIEEKRARHLRGAEPEKDEKIRAAKTQEIGSFVTYSSMRHFAGWASFRQAVDENAFR